MRRYGVAVWGVGPHARRNIVPAILRCQQLALSGLCSRDHAAVAGFAAELGCRYWANPDQMLASDDVAIVYLCTPIGLHAAHGARVLAAGKHLWCEKPLAVHLVQARSLLDMAACSALGIAEGFMYLYHPHFAALAGALRSEAIGRIRSLVCRFGIPALERPGFRLTPELGGGAFLDVGCYPISAVAALFPQEDPDIALAEILGDPYPGVDHAGRALLRYRGGTRAVLEWGTGCAYRNEIDVWGSRGSLRSNFVFSKAPGHVPSLRLRDLRGNPSTVSVAPADHFACMLRAFCATLVSGDAATQERQRILRCATLMERIRTAAEQENSDARPER